MRRAVLNIILILLPGLLSFGQVERMIIPGDLKQQTIITEPVTLRKGYLRTGVEAAFIVVDKVFDENGKRSYIQNMNTWGKRRGFIWSTQYGLSDRLELSLRVPYINQQYLVSIKVEEVYHADDSLISFKSKGNGLGDIETGARFRILEETTGRPSLTAGIDLALPTGQKNPTNIKNDLEYDYPNGNGTVALGVSLDLRKTVYPYSFRARTYYEHYFKGKKILTPGESETEFKDGDMFIIRGNFSIHLNDWIALWNEISWARFGEDTKYYEQPETSPVEWGVDYNPALYFQIRRVRFLQGIMIPVFGRGGVASPAYAFGLQYTF